MKHATLFLLAGCCLLASCHSPAQEQAQQTAAAIQDTMKTYGPPQVATSEGGYVMHAVVDGKPWKAGHMMQINAANEDFIQGTGKGTQIGFYIDLEHARPVRERPLGPGHSADVTFNGRSWHAINGGYTIDHSDGKRVDGHFHFTAQAFQSTDTMEVTDGLFRAVPKKN